MSKTYTQTLAEINAGTFADLCSEQLATLIADIMKTGGKGSISVKLSIKAERGNQTLSVEPKVDVKAPKFEPATDFFYPSKDNSLLRNHPNQQSLPLRDATLVDVSTGEVIDLATKTGPLREAVS